MNRQLGGKEAGVNRALGNSLGALGERRSAGSAERMRGNRAVKEWHTTRTLLHAPRPGGILVKR
ncbi:MAG: hypothetical protein MUE60_07225 [Candidatus Eisenbacteria bacterium]|nr:hypothetical protein [Candidatus Eisenbacteria bacterium]